MSERETDRLIDRQTDRLTDRLTDRQAETDGNDEDWEGQMKNEQNRDDGGERNSGRNNALVDLLAPLASSSCCTLFSVLDCRQSFIASVLFAVVEIVYIDQIDWTDLDFPENCR